MAGLFRIFSSRAVSFGRPKINMLNLTRMSMLSATPSGDHNRYNGGNQSFDWTKKNGFYGAAASVGAGFAVGGIMTYANKIFADEKASCSGKMCDIPEAPEPFSECFAGKKGKESPRNPEDVIVKANQDLEKSLKEAQKLAVETTNAALKTYKDAQKVFLNYLGKLYCIGAMGKDKAIQVLSTKEAVSDWCDLFIEISQMMKDLIEKESVACDLLERFREVVENGKASQYTTSNPLLITAEKALMDAEKGLRKASDPIRAMKNSFARDVVSECTRKRNEWVRCSGKKCDIPKAPEPFSEYFAGKKREESPRNLDDVIVKANQDLEKSLKEAHKLAVETTNAALKAFEDAQEVSLKYLGRLYCIETMGKDKAIQVLSTTEAVSDWCDLSIEDCQMTKDVIEKESSAWDLLERFREVVENGKASQYTTSNPLLITAEKALMDAEKRLRKVSDQIRAMKNSFAREVHYASEITPKRNEW